MNAMPIELFCSTEDVSVTPKALALASAFGEAAAASDPGKRWIICFDWGDTRRIRNKNDPHQWDDLGPGVDLVIFEEDLIPPEALQRFGDFRFALKIPHHAFERAEDRLIDLADGKEASLVLR